MSGNLARLCEKCKTFDIRSLLLAAEAQKPRTCRHSDDFVKPGLKSYFVQHGNLSELKECVDANLCELCSSIWNSYLFTYDLSETELSERDLHHGLGDKPIFLSTEDRNVSQKSLSHLVAQQHNETSSMISRRLACFEICVPYNAEVSSDSHLLARVQAASSNDEQVFALARDWIYSCEKGHASCRRDIQKSFRRPTRLLKLHQDMHRNESLTVRLVDDSRFDEPFAALSYCWGDYAPSSLILCEETESRLYEGVYVGELPETLRDTAITTFKLGLMYLWIDALCIRQDDQEDWARESARMRDVYRGAAVTIEAASANSLNDGFLKKRASSMPYCNLMWTGKQQAMHVQLRPVQDLTDAQLFGTKLYTRGWTFQERLLASRTLSFGTQQVTFECMSGYQQEARLLSQPTTLTKGRDLSKAVLQSIRTADEWYFRLLRFVLKWVGIYPSFRLFGWTFVVEPALFLHLGDAYNPSRTYQDLWSTLVHLYSQRSLSVHSDRLPAICGLAEEFEHHMDDTYVAGMWKRDLAISLGWESSTIYRDESMGNKVISSLLIDEGQLVGEWPYSVRIEHSGIPSWSWASVRGPVSLPGRDLPDLVVCATILSVKTVSKFAESNGLLASAYIDLQASFLPIPDPRLYNRIPKDWSSPHLLEEIRLRLIYKGAAAPEFYQQHHQHDGQEFGLIKLYQWNRWVGEFRLPSVQVMLLESCSDGSYRRLTSFSVRNSKSQKDFAQWHMYHDVESSRLRQRQIPLDQYLEIYRQEIQQGAELAEEMNSPLWVERSVRLV